MLPRPLSFFPLHTQLQIQEAKLQQLQNDVVLHQETFLSVCKMAESGMETVTGADGLNEEPISSVLTGE